MHLNFKFFPGAFHSVPSSSEWTKCFRGFVRFCQISPDSVNILPTCPVPFVSRLHVSMTNRETRPLAFTDLSALDDKEDHSVPQPENYQTSYHPNNTTRNNGNLLKILRVIPSTLIFIRLLLLLVSLYRISLGKPNDKSIVFNLVATNPRDMI